MKTTGAMWEDAKAKMGVELAPSFQQFLQVAQDGLPAIVEAATGLLKVVGQVAQAWMDATTNFSRYWDETASNDAKAEKRMAQLAAQGADVSSIQNARNTAGGNPLAYLLGANDGSDSQKMGPTRTTPIVLPVDLAFETDGKLLEGMIWNIARDVTKDLAGGIKKNASPVADALEALYKTDPSAAAAEAARLYTEAANRRLAELRTALPRLWGVGRFFGGTPAGTSTPPATHDAGGFLPPGMSIAVNRTGRPEPVLNPSQAGQLLNMGPVLDALDKQLGSLGQNIGQLAARGGNGGTQVFVTDSSQIERARRLARKNGRML
jgi:hypothetical protein